MSFDYIVHGTTTLFATLNILSGMVIAQYMARRCRDEFIPLSNHKP
jgi:hypothetical protein